MFDDPHNTDSKEVIKNRESLKNQAVLEELEETLDTLHDAEIARTLEQLPRPERRKFWNILPAKRRGEVLLGVNDGVREFIIDHSSAADIADCCRFLDADDLALLIRYLDSDLAQDVISKLDPEQQQDLSKILIYDEDQAGSLMNLDLLRTIPYQNVKTVIGQFRKNAERTRANDVVFVIDDERKLVGSVSVKEFLLTDLNNKVIDIMDSNPVSIVARDPLSKAIGLIQDRDLISLPVVNDSQVLLGQITVDSIVDVVEDKSSQAAYSSVGALTKDEDLFSPVWKSAVQRAWWLGINLVTAFMASGVVSQFGATIEQAVSLAVLMPIVASMGGIAGSQTMVLIIRGLALNIVKRDNISRLLNKECLVGAANGVLWAIIIAILVHLWMGELWLTGIILLSIVINIIIGTFSGVLLPMALRGVGIDPAISAHVILTTITDVVGLFVFLAMAQLYLQLFF